MPAIRTLLDGGEVTSAEDGRYDFDHLQIAPRPVQKRLPMMIGGGGERKTLRIVAGYADIWNVFGMPDTVAHKDEVLRAHCADLGRDPATIERSVGCKVVIRPTKAAAMSRYEELIRHNHIEPARLVDDVTWWVGTPEDIAQTMSTYRAVGFNTFLCETPAPYDEETMDTLMNVVKPMVDGAGGPA